MPQRWKLYNRLKQNKEDSIRKLLGDLESEVMQNMWGRGEGTVREVATHLQEKRQIAYTTVMTVMTNLAEKGLLTRRPLDKKTYLYRVALSKDEFLARSSQQMVDALITDFGDLALAQFVAAVERIDPDKLQRLQKALTATGTEDVGSASIDTTGGVEKGDIASDAPSIASPLTGRES